MSQANMFSMCFLDEIFDYGLLVDSGGVTGGGNLDDAYTDEMDMIGIGHILDIAPHGPHSAFDLFGVSMLEMDGDDFITDVITPDFTSIEKAFDPMDPPLSFDSMSRFVTCYDVMSEGNSNDMSIFEYLPVSQQFPFIAPQAPTTQIHDIDDVRNPDGPLSGQSDCDSDLEERKVTPVSGSTESMDFGTFDQLRELKIGSSLSLDERRRLINLIRYDQILMAPKDMEKTSFITKWDTYFYRVMLFGLKNVGATYQRATTTLFHDMMKLLGHIISERGIEVDSEKIKAILDMPVSDMTLGCMLAELDDLGKERAIYYMRHQETEALHDRVLHMLGFAIGSIKIFVQQTYHLPSLPVFDYRSIDDDFPDEQFVSIASIVINFIDYSLNQGAPAGHESAGTPTGHESKWRRCRGRSMRDRMHPPRMSAPSCIVPPTEQLVIRPYLVPLLPTFHGMESENPYAHIKEFEDVCNTFQEGGASIDLMRLKLFPFTLKDKAKIWLNSLRPRSIRTWTDLQAEFLKKFFPTHRTNGLKRQISNFSAKENEKFYECWERYMEAINACPHHGFDTWLLVSYFYDGMSSSMKQLLETMCGGDFMSKNPEEAMDFLNYVAEVSRGWDEPTKGEVGR
ncbi:hypothetical protein CK203_116259 [Vitis vinifera]|uniref:Retrotransposon gag domain-containing protein n=1 Tax=Vitis vinifera TaxID=29760 RepID=A0A438C8C3_VITVI|nr:hypothetical protein CK203_116259 [Vitis vinifera]